MLASKHQEEILQSLHKNLLVQACAGAGKTTTLRMIAETVNKTTHGGKSILCVAFNAAIAAEMQKKLPPSVACSTLHSHGFRAVRKHVRNVQLDKRKLQTCIDTVLCGTQNAATIAADLRKTVPLVLQTLVDPKDSTAILGVLQRVGATLEEPDKSIPYTEFVIQEMDRIKNFITYDEMITAPVRLGYAPARFDLVLVDEAQDLNESQQILIEKSITPNGRIIAVGDRYQSIYGFRGADPKAMEAMRERFGMTEKRLPVTYRCPRSVVQLAQAVASGDIISPHDNAPEGTVIRRALQDIQLTIDESRPGDLVLCRVNAPLMRYALQLVRQGRKAVVRGREIGTELANLCRRLRARNTLTLLQKLAKWEQQETEKATLTDNSAAVIAIEDKAETIRAVVEYCQSDTVAEIIERLESIFDNRTGATIFSSIHRSKGLESQRVVILGPELLPHPRAETGFALEQEKNLEYVAYTRAIDTLILQEMPSLKN